MTMDHSPTATSDEANAAGNAVDHPNTSTTEWPLESMDNHKQTLNQTSWTKAPKTSFERLPAEIIELYVVLL